VTDPYPSIERWVIPSGAAEATIDAVRPSCLDGIEAGVFWMGRRSDVATVEAVVVPRGLGVQGLPDLWQVGADVYGVISRWATPRALSLLGVVHTHPRQARPRLSNADRTRSVQAPGVLAVVIGSHGGARGADYWGWYAYEDGAYRRLDRSERSQRVEIRAGMGVESWSASLLGVRRIIA
jgi:hypothetical protein